ncbi:hypothetical protein C0Q70_16855 [Pomacea canaliculata]|uniref:Calponin-homology (CH) domain-containing protein n=1 Tax=Pomacea canaliculata TaxID=400727 RepID=A0A2T7NR07_POMCA|nr:hypothetical protein C0Q70_16855 [Pomacea canaliculata]
MTDILCRWLNDDVKISKKVDQTSFAHDFSSGYLIGEILNKHQLQNDFHLFSQARTTNAKLNNFTRMEPNMHLLGIPFDTNIARDVMTENYGVVTRLMYQLYIALNNKKKANLTGIAMETQRPAAPAKLNAVESGMYKERLKHITPRQTDLNLDEMASRFHEHQILMEQTAFRERFVEAELQRQKHQEERLMLLERARIMRAKQSEMVAKIRAATVNIPHPPSNLTEAALQEKKAQRLKREAESRILVGNHTVCRGEIDIQYILKRDEDHQENLNIIRTSSDDEYIGKIRKRLHEDSAAREEREKRRRKVLREQLAAHQAQEEAQREEMMVNRLMRQSQQERRIAVQLLQARHEKEVIRNNRMVREQQYQERRVKDFEEALNREAEMARLQKEEYKEQIHYEMERHAAIAAQRAEDRYHRHYDFCFEVVGHIVDFACKVAEYRELTAKKLPAKLVQDWKALFQSGYSLYEEESVEKDELTPEQILEEERQQLLDEGDFMEYKNMIGEWSPPEVSDIKGPPRNNPVVGHIIQRLFNMVHPPTPPPAPPEFPPYPVRACVLGKAFSGKTTVLKKLAEEHRLQILQAEKLVNEAIEAFKNNETDEVKPNLETENQPFREVPSDPTTGQPVPEPQTGDLDISTDAIITDKPSVDLLKKSLGGDPSQEGLEEVSSKSLSTQALQGKKQDSNELSVRARLGSRALKYLKKGRPVDDPTIVDILVDAIRRVPEGTGWVVDSFPLNYSQAKLLEKALSGFDADIKQQKSQKSRQSNLVPDPRPPPPPPEPSSSIDVVILFDIDDKLCLKRARGRTYAIQADQQYHEEFNPPPEGSATGLGKQEKVIPVTEPAYTQEQLQNRLTAFHDSWGKLEKWYVKFGKLKKVNAADEELAVYFEVEKILEDTISKLQGKGVETSTEQTDNIVQKVEEVPQAAPGAPPEAVPVAGLVETPPGGPDETSGHISRSRSSSGSMKKLGSATSKEAKKESIKKGSMQRNTSARKSPSGVKSSKGGKPGAKLKTPEPEPEPEPEEPPGPPPPQPADEEWEFVDLEIEQDLAAVLSTQWETVENTYVTDAKFVFHQVRYERENVYRYFYQIRKDFLEYLRRPDHKQEFVAQWQKEFNMVPDDMRDDQETRAELHQRVDDLRERLWNICDERKENAEHERRTIINDGWLNDHLGILNNYYVTLMQTELDRLQDTVRLLKDYYKGMDGQIPDPFNPQFERLPLVELPVDRSKERERDQGRDSGTPSVSSDTHLAKTESAKSPRIKSPRDPIKSPKEGGKSRTPSGKNRSSVKIEKDEVPEIGNDNYLKIKIPLIARRPRSSEGEVKMSNANKDKKKGAKKINDEGGVSESPQPPTDPDERMIFDAYSLAIAGVDQIIGAEMAAKEAEEEAERAKELEKEKAKSGKGKGGKKGSSPAPVKKGKKDVEAEITPPLSDEMTEEEKQKKQIRDKMRQEYYFSIKEEETATHMRMDLIKVIATAVIQDLKNKADSAYKDMDDWLGARFLKEMESIDTMSEVLRHAIESGQKLTYQVILQQEDFLINSDCVILKTPSPLPVPEKVEETSSDCWTVKQLYSLCQQFSTIAPSGMISSKAFMETFENLVAVSQGIESLPELWMNITPAQIQEITSSLLTKTDYVDWRRFLVALVEPIPVPTQQELLDTCTRFHEMDQKNFGYVTREQYDRMDLWFDCGSINEEEYNRIYNLKKLLFDIFADHSAAPFKMDYISMLMYFSAMPNSHEGFLRALSVASGTHMPRLQKPLSDVSRIPSNVDYPADGGNFLDTNEHDEKDEHQSSAVEPPMTMEELPANAFDALVPLDALFRVLHHGEITEMDSSRFFASADPESITSRERLVSVYEDLGFEDLKPAPYRVLIEHPIIQDVVVACNTFKALVDKNAKMSEVLAMYTPHVLRPLKCFKLWYSPKGFC